MLQVRPVVIVVCDRMYQVRKYHDQLQRLLVHTYRNPYGLKAVLEGCPSTLSFLPKPSFVCLVIPVPKAPRRYLTPTHLVFGKWGGLILQYPDTFPQVLAVKMILRDVPGPRGPRAARKGGIFTMTRPSGKLRQTPVDFLVSD